MKKAIKLILRVILTPWRRRKAQRDGVLDTSARKEYPNDVLLALVSKKIAEGHDATIIVKGYSMRPFLEHERDKVILTPIRQPLKVADAILAEISPGHYVLHRIIDIQGEDITMMGDGNIRGVEHCKVKDVRGLVTHYIRPKRTIPASDEKLQRNILRWRKLLPIRRYLLLIYKATI